MNAFLLPPPIRNILLASGFLLGISASAWSQNHGPYKNLATAINLFVDDTVSGLDMSIYAVSPQPKNGEVDVILLQPGGSGNPYVYAVRYIPDPGFSGTDTFTIEINYQGSYPYLIYRGYRVSVFPSIVTAEDDFAVTSAGAPVSTNVLDNDSSTKEPLTLSAIAQVKNGTALITGSQSIQFTPAPGFTGVGYVNYVVCDSVGTCKTAQYAIGVNDNSPPENDTLRMATAKNTALTMPLRHNGYSLFQSPANGSVYLPDDHSFRYTPNTGFTGFDQFVLSTDAYGPPVTKTVILQVLNTPALNTMALPDTRYTPKNTPISFNVRQNDIGNLLVKSWMTPANFKGSISNTNGIGNVTFTPDTDFSGVTTFYYKIGNMFVPDLEMAAVDVIVGNMNPSAATFELTTPKETPMVVNYKIPFTGFNFSVTDQPDHGELVFYPGFTTQTINGQTVSGHNLLVYTPDDNFSGPDEFEINYCVVSNGQCKSVKISMSVVDVISAPGPHCVDDCVWTGDVNADGVVNNKDILPLGYFMGLSGPERDNASLEWYGQHSGDWDNPYIGAGADLKHADTDGNGFVDTADTLAIGLFYGQTHQLTPYISPSSKGLPFFLNILTPDPGVGDLVQIEIALGSADKPVTNLYGFTFNASLSPLIVDSALQIKYYSDSWLNANAADIWMYKTPAQGRLESAFTRTNGVPTSGYGIIGEMSFIIIDIIDGGRPERSIPSLSLKVEAPAVMWSDGSCTSGEALTLEIPLRLLKPGPASDKSFIVYPSPTDGLLQIHLNGEEFIENLLICDLSGKVMYDSGPVQWEHTILDLGQLPAGIYLASARTTNRHVVKKFQIMR